MGDSKDEIQNQYRKIILNIWRDEPIFGGELPKDSATFWSKILKFHRSDGIYPFKELATYALAALSIPVSNAVVERTFTHVTWVKSKYRTGTSNVRPAGRMRPANGSNAARKMIFSYVMHAARKQI